MSITADSDTVSTYQIPSMQLVTDKKSFTTHSTGDTALQSSQVTDHSLNWTKYRPHKCDGLSYALLKPLASCRSPTALKRPDRSKQCQCLQFAKCIASSLHYYNEH